MTRRAIRSAIVILLAAIVLGGCDANSTLPITHMRLGSQDFTLEIAGSFHTREVGLMHRDSLASDHGMLFVFSDVEPQTFWNHDVRFPLDVVFLDADGRIVSVIHMNAYSDQNVDSGGAIKYAIELNAGTAERLHLSPGTQLTVPSDASKALVPDK